MRRVGFGTNAIVLVMLRYTVSVFGVDAILSTFITLVVVLILQTIGLLQELLVEAALNKISDAL